MSTGFYQVSQSLWIDKDPEAQLIYTFDWSQWLDGGDVIDTAEYTITARINDPHPLVKVSEGITGGNKKTYVELSDGGVDKSYTVSVKVTTRDGWVDRRSFRVKVLNRSA